MLKYKNERELVYNVSMGLFKRGFIIASAGNISMRIPGKEQIAITPSGIRYELMKVEDIVIADLHENVVDGDRIPSSELPLHTIIYKEFPDVNSIIHTHSPYAVAFSSNHMDIPMISMECLKAGTNRILVTEQFCMPGTKGFGIEAVKTLKKQVGSKAILLANHGLLTVGDCLYETASLAESIEIEAKISTIARGIGNPIEISEETRSAIEKYYKRFNQNIQKVI